MKQSRVYKPKGYFISTVQKSLGGRNWTRDKEVSSSIKAKKSITDSWLGVVLSLNLHKDLCLPNNCFILLNHRLGESKLQEQQNRTIINYTKLTESLTSYCYLASPIELVNLLTECCELLDRQGRLLVATVSLNELGDVFKQDSCDPHNEICTYVVKTTLFSLLGFMQVLFAQFLKHLSRRFPLIIEPCLNLVPCLY